MHPKLICFNFDWLVIWLPSQLLVIAGEGGQITSQLESKQINLGCSKGECRISTTE